MGLCESLLEQEQARQAGRFPDLRLKTERPVDWEILYTKLAGVVQNSRETARKISASPVVKEMGECIFALFTPEGDSICFSTGLLLHVASMGSAVKWMLKNGYEQDPGIREGDYFFNNDPYIGGTHTPDQLIITPIYYAGRCIGWAGGLTHVPETGATAAGGNTPMSSSRFDDGITMPCVKVAENDCIRRDLEIMVDRGTRQSIWWLLDNRAKIAGSRLIRDEVKALVAEYGIDFFQGAIYEYIEDTRRACRKKVRDVLCPGTYKGVHFYDVPYADKPVRQPKDHEIALQLEMTIAPDGQMHLNYDGTSPAGIHPNNATLVALQGGIINMLVQNVFYDIKYNQGIEQCFTLHVPPSVLNPPRITYSTSIWATARIAATIVGECVGRGYYVMGHREEAGGMIAGGSRMCLGGIDQYGRPFGLALFEHGCGGLGGGPGLDGLDTAGAFFNPEGDMGDAEVWERVMPLMWLGRRIHPDSGGFGRYRGGNRIESLYVVENTDEVEMGSVVSHTRVFSLPGVMGAYPAAAAYRYIYNNTDFAAAVAAGRPLPHNEGDDPANPTWLSLLQGESILTDAQCLPRPVLRHSLWQQLNTGGSGHGDPIERDPESVRRDLENGVTTLRTAGKVYGVVVDPHTFAVDRAGTTQLRQTIRQQRLARSLPASEYLAQARQRVEQGNLPPVVRESLNDRMRISPKFRGEFQAFWGLPETFAAVPEALTAPAAD